MPKIAELKGDVLRFLLRSRNVSVSGTRAELVQRLIEFEQSEDGELTAAVGINMQQEETMLAQSAAIAKRDEGTKGHVSSVSYRSNGKRSTSTCRKSATAPNNRYRIVTYRTVDTRSTTRAFLFRLLTT